MKLTLHDLVTWHHRREATFLYIYRFVIRKSTKFGNVILKNMYVNPTVNKYNISIRLGEKKKLT